MYGVVHKIHRDLLTLLNSFLSVNEKEKFFRKRSCRDVCKKKALSGVCSSGVRLPNEKPAKISLQTNRRSQIENKVSEKSFSATLQSHYFLHLMKSEIATLLYSCSPKKVPLYGQAYPYRPCIGSTSRACHLRETEARIVLFSYSQANTLYGPISFHRSRIIKGLINKSAKQVHSYDT